MKSTPVSGGAVVSEVMLIGRPGSARATLKRPSPTPLGKHFSDEFEHSRNDEAALIQIISPPFVLLFPGNPGGTDRSGAGQIRNCSSWMNEGSF